LLFCLIVTIGDGNGWTFSKNSSGGRVGHTEHWLLTKALIDESEESIDVNILPLVNSFLYNKIKSIIPRS